MKKRDMTLQEAWYKLGKAWRELILETAKLLGIIRLLDWLEKKMEERR